MTSSRLWTRIWTLVAVAGSVAIWMAAWLAAVGLGPAPGPLLDGWSAAFELPGGLLHSGGEALAWLRGPLLVALAALVVWHARASSRPGAVSLALAVGLAAVAQSWLADGWTLLASALYAAAGALVWRRQARAAPTASDVAPAEAAALLAVMALFALACLARLDVFPDVDFDELSYAVAARMQLGELERTWVMAAHPFTRFQAQPLPLVLQAAGVAISPPGILPIRLVSFVLCGGVLLVAWLALRRRLGAGAALGAAALCAVTPLFLASARAGHYMAFTLLHAVACLAALLRLVERRDLGSALALGALLGLALYAYQLSWFVPVLAALAYVLTWERTRLRQWVSQGAAVVAVAALLAAPALLWMQGGLLAVLAQTLDKAVWSEGGPGAPELWDQPVVLARGRDATATRKLTELGDRAGLRVHVMPAEADEPLVHLSGRAPVVEVARAELRRVDASFELDTGAPPGPWTQAARMTRQLFRAPSLEFKVRVVAAPLLGAIMAPLAVLGLAEALRRRREPVMRVLIVFAIGGALLPAAIGGTVARRAALMLPAVCALAALPPAALWREAGALAPHARRVARIAVAAVALLAALDGLHGYFAHWHRDVRPHAVGETAAAPAGGLLALSELLRAQPADRPTFLPRHFRYFKPYWKFVEERPDPAGDARVREWPDADGPGRVREISCGLAPPFAWLGTPAQAALFAPLADTDRTHVVDAGAYRIWEVESRAPGACATGSPAGER